MAATRSSAAHASVVFLKIPEFSRHPVAEQARLKGRLEGVVAAALPGLAEEERVVLEAPDAAAIVVLGNPGAAFDFARRSLAAEDGAGLATGISHGAVRVVDESATPIVLGDAFVVAAAVADFAPGGIAATREFRDILARAAPGQARRFVAAGTRQGADDRSYEVFLFDETAAATRRRRFASMTLVACAAIIALGFALRSVRGPSPGDEGVPVLATLRFEIRPQGEVFIDGVAKGRTPPLASIQIAAGKHTVEVRNGRFNPLVMQVQAGPGEELAIRHSFVAPQPKPFWRRWLDQLK